MTGSCLANLADKYVQRTVIGLEQRTTLGRVVRVTFVREVIGSCRHCCAFVGAAIKSISVRQLSVTNHANLLWPDYGLDRWATINKWAGGKGVGVTVRLEIGRAYWARSGIGGHGVG